MKAAASTLRDRLRTQLADLKMPGALEAVDGILHQVDGGHLSPPAAMVALLDAQIGLRNSRRLQTTMRSSRLPAIKTLADFDFTFQPSVKRDQLESLHSLGFLDRHENIILLGPPGSRQDALSPEPRRCDGGEWATRLLRDAGGADRLPGGGPTGRHAAAPAQDTGLLDPDDSPAISVQLETAIDPPPDGGNLLHSFDDI